MTRARRARHAVPLQFVAALAVVLLASALVLAQAVDPFEGMDPHAVPGCKPRGGPQFAACRCLGMVHNIRGQRTVDCWESAGVMLPRDEKERGLILDILSPNAPEAVKNCLAAMPDHCEIVAKTLSNNVCRTRCRPDRCGCADEACKAHGETERY